MLTQALERALGEDDDALAAVVFDDLGNVVAEASRIDATSASFDAVVTACLAARAQGAAIDELRMAVGERAFVARPIDAAFVALAAPAGAPLGRLALRLRLHHDALLAALP
jgi:hypothetical protein